MNQYSAEYEPLSPDELSQLRAELAYNKGKPWSQHDETVLATMYPTHGSRECALALGRTEDSVKAKARRQGITCSRPVWSEEKLEWVKRNYHKVGLRGCAKYLSVSPKAVSSALWRYGIDVFPKEPKRRCAWTEREDQMVVRMVELIAEGLGRSNREVYGRILTLKRRLNRNEL